MYTHTSNSPTSRFATMTASQVLDEQARLMDRWAREDAERAERRRAILDSAR